MSYGTLYNILSEASVKSPKRIEKIKKQPYKGWFFSKAYKYKYL